MKRRAIMAIHALRPLVKELNYWRDRLRRDAVIWAHQAPFAEIEAWASRRQSHRNTAT